MLQLRSSVLQTTDHSLLNSTQIVATVTTYVKANAVPRLLQQFNTLTSGGSRGRSQGATDPPFSLAIVAFTTTTS